MEQYDQWAEEEVEEAALQHRKRDTTTISTTTTTTSSSYSSSTTTSITISGNKSDIVEVAAVEELSDSGNYILGLDEVSTENGKSELEKSVSIDKDSESTYDLFEMQYGGTECSVIEANPGDQKFEFTEKITDIPERLSAVIKHQYNANLKDKRFSDVSLRPLDKCHEEQTTSFTPLNNGTVENAGVNPRKESRQDVAELGVSFLPSEMSHEEQNMSFESLNNDTGHVDVIQRKESSQEVAELGVSFLPSEKSHEEQNTSFESFNNGSGHADIARIKEIGQEVGELDVRLLSLEKLLEEQSSGFKPLNNVVIENADIILVKEREHEVAELDVESVLAKQDTHDLYCPNCNSCITRRVILCKRKRKVENIHLKVKRDKPEIRLEPELDADPAYVANDFSHDRVDISTDANPTPAVDDYHQDRDIFRCLSCFSFFIPTGNRFKSFRIFGDGSENAGIQNPPHVDRNENADIQNPLQDDRIENSDMQKPREVAATNTNWFFSIFTSEKWKKTNEQGGAAQGDSSKFTGDSLIRYENDHPTAPVVGGTLASTGEPADDAILKSPRGENGHVSSKAPLFVQSSPGKEHEYNATQPQPKEEGKDGVVFPEQGSMLPEKVVTHLGGRSDDSVEIFFTGHSESYYSVTQTGGPPVNNEEPAEDSTTKLQVGELKIPVLSTAEIAQRFDMETGNDAQNGHASLNQESPLPAQSFSAGVTTQVTHPGEPGKSIIVSLNQGSILIERMKTDVGVLDDARDDMSLTVKPTTSERPDDITSLQAADIETGTQILTDAQRRAEPTEVHSWDILKSIVYGGLNESIASLGVVSSAAGANATTLNVLALGLANLIGGLLLICNDLRELKNDDSGVIPNQTYQQRDRHVELLGRRENFKLHAVVAVLSYLLLGVMPPVIYGFSFRTTDNRDYKLGAVAAASLLCIILLALGKAHVRRPPKSAKSYIKTILNYVFIGIMASGASYIAGSLIEKLLEELGLFETSPAVGVGFIETGPGQSGGWASY